jgi:hypothetical protein
MISEVTLPSTPITLLSTTVKAQEIKYKHRTNKENYGERQDLLKK